MGRRTFRLLREHYFSFFAPTDSFASRSGLSSTSVSPRWRSLRRLSTSPCCPPDLPDVISEYLFLDAGSHTPAVPQRAYTCFFRCVIGLPHKELGRLPACDPLETTSCGPLISERQIFLYVPASNFALPPRSSLPLRVLPQGPSRGDPMHFRLPLAVSAVSSFVPV